MPAALVYSVEDGLTKRQEYERIKAGLFLERTSFNGHYKELGEYFLPRRPRFFVTDRNRGDQRSKSLVDLTPRFAARTLQSGLHAGLTSPARPWFNLGVPDPSLARFGPVKAWLHSVTERMRTVFQLSNLYNALPVLYGDLGVFATTAMAVLEDSEDLFRCYTYPVGSYAIGLDARGLATTFVREYQLSVRELVETFGGPDGTKRQRGQPVDWSRFSRTVKTLYENKSYQAPVDVCWLITPAEDYDPRRLDARRWPWSSSWFESGSTEGSGLLRESGFRTFPILCPRWDVTGEDIYGTDCPGMTALGDAKALQIMQKRKAQAVEKMVNPPVQAPTTLLTQKVSLIASDVTFVDVREGGQGVRPIHEVRADVADLTGDIRETQYRIQRAFYEDLFLMLAQSDASRGAQPVTAREIEERHEEKLLALGPVLERTNDELLDPLIDRVYGLMDDAGLIPPPPPELEGVELKVEYVSLMAQAQKLVGTVGQDRFLQSIANVSTIWPAARHKVRPFAVVDSYADQLGVDPSIVRDDDEAQQLADGEQQAMAAAQQAQAEALQAKSARDLAGAELEGDTVLKRMMEGRA